MWYKICYRILLKNVVDGSQDKVNLKITIHKHAFSVSYNKKVQECNIYTVWWNPCAKHRFTLFWFMQKFYVVKISVELEFQICGCMSNLIVSKKNSPRWYIKSLTISRKWIKVFSSTKLNLFIHNHVCITTFSGYYAS